MSRCGSRDEKESFLDFFVREISGGFWLVSENGIKFEQGDKGCFKVTYATFRPAKYKSADQKRNKSIKDSNQQPLL